jgi:hypothetical protein
MIPAVIHQIWLPARDAAPQHMLRWSSTFKEHNPTFKHILWDYALLSEHFDVQAIIEDYGLHKEHPAMHADIWRKLVVNKFGGFYFDLDCECVSSLTPLLYHIFVTNVTRQSNAVLYSFSEFFGAVERGRMLGLMLEECVRLRKNACLDVHQRAGYKLFHRVLMNNIDVDVTLLGPDAFTKYFIHHFANTWCAI